MVALTASTVTNIVTQYTTISASTQMPDILNASTEILYPNSSSNATVVVTLIKITSSGTGTVVWSQATSNGTAMKANATVTVASALGTTGTYLVLGQVTYVYTPILDYMHLGPITLSSSVYMVPRDATTINLVT
jgi:hypothetical protein